MGAPIMVSDLYDVIFSFIPQRKLKIITNLDTSNY